MKMDEKRAREILEDYIDDITHVGPVSEAIRFMLEQEPKTCWIDLGDGEYKCPKCHKEFINGMDIENMTKFFPKCPNCGCRMESVKQEPNVGHCKDCKWWKDSDGEYRRGVSAESKCPINTKTVYLGDGYCYKFEPKDFEVEQ